jgi:protein-tyrosine-phosphatase
MAKKVLILCTGNSARSQIAEGLFQQEAGDGFEVFSAGTRPARVHPEAIAVTREIGIDISGQRSKSVDEFAGKTLDLIITVCDNANETCPVFPGGPSGCIGRFKTRLWWRIQRSNEKPRSARSGIRFTQGSGPSSAIRVGSSADTGRSVSDRHQPGSLHCTCRCRGRGWGPVLQG